MTSATPALEPRLSRSAPDGPPQAPPPARQSLELYPTPQPPERRLRAATRQRLEQALGTIIELEPAYRRWSARLTVA